jgi:catechol 2,3-dioxygenase-like lactoylglutathione lyase family enzyme
VKVESLDHIHVYSKDPEVSASFYKRHFEAAEVFRNDNVYGQTRIFLSLGGQLVVVGPFPPDISPADPPAPGDGAYGHGFGVAHFGLRVADVEAAVRELSGQGVAVIGGPTRERSGLIYAYVAAPDGVVLELTQYGSAAQPLDRVP